MTPVEIGKGRSFKGLASYLLYEKAAAESDAQQIGARVGWAQSFNLLDAEPDRAWRLMASTAMSAEQLKDAAGIRKGKATEKPVYHYSLNFNPKDRPSEETQRRAVASSLEALGLSEYQALAVMHHDKDHIHVHVMVNLINPEHGVSAASKQPDGRAAPLSMTQKKLSQWALKFERDHGLEVTEGRIANQAARQQGEKIEAKRLSRPAYEFAKASGNEPRTAWMRREQEDRRALLVAEQVALRDRQRAAWEALNESFRQQRQAMRAHQVSFKQISAGVRDQHKPAWADLFRRQRHELRQFEASDRTMLGKLWHGAAAAVVAGKEHGALSALAAAFSKEARQAVVLRQHQRQADELRRIVAARIKTEIENQKRVDRQAQEAARKNYLARCAALKGEHDQQWTAMRSSWRDYNADRKATMEKARTPIRSRDQDRGQQRGQDQGRGIGRRLDPK